MSARKAERIELCVDVGAAALLAYAVALAASWVAAPSGLAAVPVAFLACLVGLRRIVSEAPTFELADFTVMDAEFEEADELLLTDADRLSECDDALVLDDVLAGLGDDSRVVRLFDPSAMPTPGQLKAQIDRHLGGPVSGRAAPDATQALHEALAELRSSLR
jgi:hypothetical protein